MPLHGERLKTLFDGAVRTFNARRKAPFRPALEVVFAQSAAPRPTTSATGAVVKGVLSALVGNRQGQARQTFEQGQREASQAEAFNNRRQAFQDAIAMDAARNSLEMAKELSNPAAFEVSPRQAKNLQVLSGLFGSPGFVQAQMNDPSFFKRALSTVTAANPRLGLKGFEPRRRPLVLSKGQSLFVPGEGLVQAPEGPAVKPQVRPKVLVFENEAGELREGLFDQLTGELIRDLRSIERRKSRTSQKSPFLNTGQVDFVFDPLSGELVPRSDFGARATRIPTNETAEDIISELWPVLQQLSDADLMAAISGINTGHVDDGLSLRRFLISGQGGR